MLASAVAFFFDRSVALTLHAIGVSTRLSAMTGVTIGALSGFFFNRYFAFPESNALILKPFFKWLFTTVIQITLHGQLCVWLTDLAQVPFLVSTIVADLVVFTFGQPLLYKFYIFRTSKTRPVVESKVEHIS